MPALRTGGAGSALSKTEGHLPTRDPPAPTVPDMAQAGCRTAAMVLEDSLAVAVAKVSTGGSQGGAEPGPHAGAANRMQSWRRVRKGWEPPTFPQPMRDAALSL